MKNILVVDDEHLLLHSLSAALRKDDVGVTSVSCGKDALAAINKAFYHLCILDINLPDANGLDIMKTLRETSPETNIIIMSCDLIEDDVQKNILKTGCCFLPKPFDLADVRTLVNCFLREKASADGAVPLPPLSDLSNGNANKTM
jgi:DNA-binding response OmpR family regulator